MQREIPNFSDSDSVRQARQESYLGKFRDYEEKDDARTKLNAHELRLLDLDGKMEEVSGAISEAIALSSTTQSEIKKLKNEAERENERIRSELKSTSSELKKDRFLTIQVLGFFVAFFTFISVQFQLFANLTYFNQYVALSLIVFGMLVSFIIIFSRLIRQSPALNIRQIVKTHFKGYRLIIFAIACIILGIVVTFYDMQADVNRGHNEYCTILIKEIITANGERIGELSEKYSVLQCSGVNGKDARLP